MVGPTSGLPGSFAMERGGEVRPAWRRVPLLAAVQEGLGVSARLSAGVAGGARGCRALRLHHPPRPCGSSLTWSRCLLGTGFPLPCTHELCLSPICDSGLLESKPCRGLAAAWVTESAVLFSCLQNGSNNIAYLTGLLEVFRENSAWSLAVFVLNAPRCTNPVTCPGVLGGDHVARSWAQSLLIPAFWC